MNVLQKNRTSYNLLVIDKLLGLVLREPLLFEAWAVAPVVCVSLAARSAAIACSACLSAPFGALSDFDVFVTVEHEVVLLLVLMGGRTFGSHRAGWTCGLLVNALGDVLEIQEGLLSEFLARWRLVHLLV